MKKTTKLSILFAILSTFLFNSSYALNGDYDSNTYNSSNCIYLTYDLKYKSQDKYTNDEVSKVQNFLQERGYLNADPTGYFGLMTQNAVKSYQINKGLVSTGYVGSYTRQMIQTDSCNSTSNSNTNNYNTTLLSSLTLDPSILTTSINGSKISKYPSSLTGGIMYTSLESLRFKTNIEFETLKRYNVSMVNSNLNTSAITFVNTACQESVYGACYTSPYGAGNSEYYGYVNIDLKNSNLIDAKNYYFTLRFTDPNNNSSYREFTYNFNYINNLNTLVNSNIIQSNQYYYPTQNYSNYTSYPNYQYTNYQPINYQSSDYSSSNSSNSNSGLGAFIGTTANLR